MEFGDFGEFGNNVGNVESRTLEICFRVAGACLWCDSCHCQSPAPSPLLMPSSIEPLHTERI